nr:hypothetical protein AOSUZXEW_AOSUZXEW_CDS_0007 [Microvirus sp.]
MRLIYYVATDTTDQQRPSGRMLSAFGRPVACPYWCVRFIFEVYHVLS